nr:uncharacterized protein LOC111769926 [Equus caballus]
MEKNEQVQVRASRRDRPPGGEPGAPPPARPTSRRQPPPQPLDRAHLPSSDVAAGLVVGSPPPTRRPGPGRVCHTRHLAHVPVCALPPLRPAPGSLPAGARIAVCWTNKWPSELELLSPARAGRVGGCFSFWTLRPGGQCAAHARLCPGMQQVLGPLRVLPSCLDISSRLAAFLPGPWLPHHLLREAPGCRIELQPSGTLLPQPVSLQSSELVSLGHFTCFLRFFPCSIQSKRGREMQQSRTRREEIEGESQSESETDRERNRTVTQRDTNRN